MGETLGGFEQLVLLAVLRLGDEAYGAAIAEELELRTGRTVSQGAVYVTLRRLRDRGWLASRQGEARPERGGRPRRYHVVRAEGLRALREARDEWDALAEGLEDLLREGR